MHRFKFFETERLLIRPTSEEDAAFMFRLYNSPKWIRFIGDRNVHTVEDAKEQIKNRMLPQLERLGFSNYTLIRKTDLSKMGICGLYDREGLDGIDLGFALLTEYENAGYAFEASSRLKTAAFEDFKLTELKAITVRENTASQKLLEKLGFSLEGTTRLPNDDEELLLYKVEG